MAFSTHDQVSDSPTNTFATWNPLDAARDNTVISDGNLASTDTSGGYAHGYANIVVPNTGLYYVEFTVKIFGSSNAVGVYIGNYRDWPNIYGSTGYAYDSNTFMLMHNGSIYSNGATQPYHPTFAAGDVVALIIDGSSRNIWLQKNGNVISGDSYATGSQSGGVVGALSGISALPDGDIYVFTMASGSANPAYSNSTIVMNAGQDHTFGGYPNSLASSSGYSDANGIGSFYHQPPTGALALCTANLPDPDIDPAVDDLPEDYFKSVIYTGNGSTQSITSVGFQPDLVWCKNRTTSGSNHRLFDSVRGASSILYSSLTNAAATDATGLTSFDSTGFSIGANQVNDNNANFVAWCFRAGGSPSGSTSTTGSAKRINTSGTQDDTSCSALASAATSAGASNVITPTLMSINQKAGFSIVKYSGNNSIPHGLSSPLDLLIVKNLDLNGEGWTTWHSSFSSGDYVYLNSNQQKYYSANKFTGIPTSNVFIVGSDNSTGSSSYNYIAYCWHSVAGYSAFGSYTGNGSTTDGPFIYTGFKPAWVMTKNIDTSTSAHWTILDNTRSGYNLVNAQLYSDLSNAEQNNSGRSADFLSNGFKIRGIDHNASNNTHIYAAFAEMPQKYSATNAR